MSTTVLPATTKKKFMGLKERFIDIWKVYMTLGEVAWLRTSCVTPDYCVLMRWWTTWAEALRDIVGFGERLQTTWGEVELYKEWCCEIGLTTLASYWAIFPPDQATSISRGDNQVFNFEASNSKSKSNSYPLGWTILRQIFIFCSTLRDCFVCQMPLIKRDVMTKCSHLRRI